MMTRQPSSPWLSRHVTLAISPPWTCTGCCSQSPLQQHWIHHSHPSPLVQGKLRVTGVGGFWGAHACPAPSAPHRTRSHLGLLVDGLVAGTPWPGGVMLLDQLPVPESHSPQHVDGAQHLSPCKERGPHCLSPFATEEGISPALSIIPRAPNPDITAALRGWGGLCVELLLSVQHRVGIRPTNGPMMWHSLHTIHEIILFDIVLTGRFLFFCITGDDAFPICVFVIIVLSMRGAF